MVKKQSVGIRESYSLYKKEVKNAKSIADYLSIAQGFAQFLTNKLLEGEEIGLPEGLGRMKFIGHKTKPRLGDKGEIVGLAPDWRSTNELWAKDPVAKERKTLIYFFNEHSNGVRYRLHWIKKNMNVRNKDFFSFRLSRMNKHSFRDMIKSGKEYNVELSKILNYVKPQRS